MDPHPVTAQVWISGHPYYIPNPADFPSADLDVPYHSPTPNVTSVPITPTDAVGSYITNTPPPPFVPASGFVVATPTIVIVPTTIPRQPSPLVKSTITLSPNNFAPTSALNREIVSDHQDTLPSSSGSTTNILAIALGFVLGTYTTFEQSVLNFFAEHTDRVSVETARVIFRVLLSLPGAAAILVVGYHRVRKIKREASLPIEDQKH